MATKPDFLALLQSLARHEVEHVVVGGVAAILEGAPVTPLDLDVVYLVDEFDSPALRGF